MGYASNILMKGAELIAKNDYTVRQAANAVGVGKSTLHKYCQKELLYESSSLYHEVQDKLSAHLQTRHINGGEATRKRWLARAAA